MKQNQIHRKESSSKEELPFELSSLNQKLEVSAQAQSLVFLRWFAADVQELGFRTQHSVWPQCMFCFRHLGN